MSFDKIFDLTAGVYFYFIIYDTAAVSRLRVRNVRTSAARTWYLVLLGLAHVRDQAYMMESSLFPSAYNQYTVHPVSATMSHPRKTRSGAIPRLKKHFGQGTS